jgi:hypothetical protein
MATASSGVHGQLVSSISSTSGPAASRAARTDSTSTWWSLSIRKPCFRYARHASATWAGDSYRMRLA